MKKLLFILSLFALGLVGCSATAPTKQSAKADPVPAMATVAKWSCSVQAPAKLIAASYSGGSWANVWIAPYSSGGNYRVTKNGDNMATGRTANGTPFTCTALG